MLKQTSLGIRRLTRAEKFVSNIEKELAKEGESIDPGIRAAVIIFNAFGLYTRSSCEGHIKNGNLIAAHIDVIPFPEKELMRRWGREGKANLQRRKFLEKNDKPVNQYTKRERAFLDRTWKEMHLLDRTMAIFTFRLIILLEQFYKNRKTTADARLILWDPLGRQVMLISQGGRVARHLPMKQSAPRSVHYQKELFDFVALIKSLVLKGKTFRSIRY